MNKLFVLLGVVVLTTIGAFATTSNTATSSVSLEILPYTDIVVANIGIASHGYDNASGNAVVTVNSNVQYSVTFPEDIVLSGTGDATGFSVNADVTLGSLAGVPEVDAKATLTVTTNDITFAKHAGIYTGSVLLTLVPAN